MRYQPLDCISRVADAISNQSPVNLDNFNMYNAVVDPDFKSVKKKLWKTKNGFSVK